MKVRRQVPLVTIPIGQRTTALRYSPDGVYIASGSYNRIHICDARTGRAVGDLMKLQDNFGWVTSICYSPDGAHIASTYNSCPDVWIWDTRTGQTRGQPLRGHNDTVNTVVYSSDGAYIVSGSEDTTVRVWDAHTGLMIGGSLCGHTDSIWLVAHSPTTPHVAAVCSSHIMRVWNTLTGRLVCDPVQTSDDIGKLVYLPDGTRLASVCRSGVICSWDAQTGQTISIVESDDDIGLAAYPPDLTYIAHLRHKRMLSTLCKWEADRYRMNDQPVSQDPDFPSAIACSPDGTCIASGSGSAVCIWDAHARAEATDRVRGHAGTILAVAYSPDSRHIACASDDNTVRIWDAYTGQEVAEPLHGLDRDLSMVTYSPNGRYLLLCSSKYGDCNSVPWMKIWDTLTGLVRGHLTAKFDAAAWSPDGAYVVIGNGREPLQYWSVNTSQFATTPSLNGHTEWRTPFSYSPDGTHVAAVSDAGNVRIWDLDTGEAVGQPLADRADVVKTIVHSSDGAMVAISSDEPAISVWDALSGRAIGKIFSNGEIWPGPVICLLGTAYISCHGYNSLHFFVSDESAIQAWDLGAGQSIRPLYGHTAHATLLVSSPDGTFFASGSVDRTIRVWGARLVRAVHSQDRDLTGISDGLHPQSLMSSTVHTDSHICSSSCTASGFHKVWKLNKDGWVVLDDNKPLVWVPPDLRDTLLYPFNTLVISQKGSLRLEFDESKIGDRWQEQFKPMDLSQAMLV